MLKQLSIFISNEAGRLADITGVLRDKGIDIKALSIADTTDFGILRVIVDQPEAAESCLKEAGFTVSITTVLAIGISDRPGGLCSALELLRDHDITVEYMYAFVGRLENLAYVIIRVDDIEKTAEILKAGQIAVLDSSALDKI